MKHLDIIPALSYIWAHGDLYGYGLSDNASGECLDRLQLSKLIYWDEDQFRLTDMGMEMAGHQIFSELKQRAIEHEAKRAYTEHIKAERRKMTPKLRVKVLARDKFTCQICGRSPKQDGVSLCVDHIKPIARGGFTECSNLQTLCFDCNIGKGKSLEDELGT